MKSAAISALFALLVLSARVEAFGVALTSITIHTTAEYGGVPEIYIECNRGTSNYIFRDLPLVNVANYLYRVDVTKASAIFDRHLGLFEKHYCGVYESDSSIFDYDKENNVDDFFGYFTIARSDFKTSKHIAKHLPNRFTVSLACFNC